MAVNLLPQDRMPQPGSIERKWNINELTAHGATGTSRKYLLNLNGEIHPVFRNWTNTDLVLRKELEQPLLLASRLVEHAGLEWISDFIIDDIFDERYPGQGKCQCSRPYCNQKLPKTIVRHHRADWATEELKRSWTIEASQELEWRLSGSIDWHLDADMFHRKGWTGYTCRHPRVDLQLDQVDKHELIEEWDCRIKAEGLKHRKLSLSLMSEYPQILSGLPKDSEEYLLTAFMAAVTMVHALGHAMFWRDFRSSPRNSSEPFYGADLEMGLGNSLVAHIFGGWVPVPIKDTMARARKHANKHKQAPTFKLGVAWRQHLTWDYHRLRPKHRAHYSIPVTYICTLFEQKSWNGCSDALALIRPNTLRNHQHDIGIKIESVRSSTHATAALPDYYASDEGWRWYSRERAPFRVPQYDGHLWPDIDLPIAANNAVNEPQARSSLHKYRASLLDFVNSVNSNTFMDGGLSPDRFWPPNLEMILKPSHPLHTNNLSKTLSPLGYKSGDHNCLSSGNPEMTIDELKKRLSSLIRGSFDEFEVMFDNL